MNANQQQQKLAVKFFHIQCMHLRRTPCVQLQS